MCWFSCDGVGGCIYASVGECVTKRQLVGVFEGGVPLPRVFSFLSCMLMASDAPSGICEEGEGERKEGGRKVEEKGHGVRGERGCTRTASLSTPSRECPAEGFACACVLALRASREVASLREPGRAH